MSKKITVTESSGNIFADLELPNAEERLRQAQLAAAAGPPLRDLINNADLRRAFYATEHLAVDEFADEHAVAIQRFYVEAGRPMDLAEARQLACEVWGKLRRGEDFDPYDA